jgi:hypothetical protein
MPIWRKKEDHPDKTGIYLIKVDGMPHEGGVTMGGFWFEYPDCTWKSNSMLPITHWAEIPEFDGEDAS